MPESENVASDQHLVNDQAFVAEVKRLRQLRTFLYKQALSVEMPTTPLAFEEIESLAYSARGRSPSVPERVTVDRLTETIFRTLSEPLRRKFLMGELPWWLSGLPMIFAAVAVISLVAIILIVSTAPPKELQDFIVSIVEARTGAERSVSVPPPGSTIVAEPVHPSNKPPDSIPLGAKILPLYLMWLMSLGATGAVAFIGMNVLSVQEDATFDLTNTRLMALRITTGALFGLVLTLPFGFNDFLLFCVALVSGGGSRIASVDLTKQAAMLLLPFVLGFSTSLVIMLLNQFIDGVQAFFGKKTIPASATSLAPPLAPAKPSTPADPAPTPSAPRPRTGP